MEDGSVAVVVALIAASPGLLAVVQARINRKQIATSDGKTIGELTEQIADRQDRQEERIEEVRRAVRDLKGDVVTLTEMQSDTFQGLLDHVIRHDRDDSRHVNRRGGARHG